MPKLKWNDCSSTMINVRPEEVGRVSRKLNAQQRKCLSLGKASADRKWVDYSNSKIFIKKRPNHEYNILRQVLSRDKQLSETLKYEVKWTDYSQQFMHSPNSSPPYSPSSGSSSAPSSPPTPSPPPTPPSQSQLNANSNRYMLSASCPAALESPMASSSINHIQPTPEISFATIEPNYLIHAPPSASAGTTTSYHLVGTCTPYQHISTPTDSFYLEIQPLPIMDTEIYNYA